MSHDIIALSDRVFVVHYHEIGLKGRNRDRFEERLCVNVRRALAGLPFKTVRRISGRLLVALQGDSPVDLVARRLRTVFGIAYVAPAVVCGQNIATLRETAWALLRDLKFETFKIDAKRSEKKYPLTSVGINTDVGEAVRLRSGARVQLKDPDLTCYIEIVEKIALLFTERMRGPGGLPSGISGRAVSLISSGIDSPVASYKIMKRGVEIVFVHFHSQPYTDRNSQRNVEEIVSVLTRHQYRSTLYLVPFIGVQEKIMAGAPASHRVILYRRAMLRIAERIAHQEGAKALVTGENIGQVASQTLSNILAINEVATLPVLRPLSGEDKEEIVAAAQRIGTYDISIEPYEDCCSLFVPRNPETHASAQTVRNMEAGLDLDPIIEQVLAASEVKTFEADFSKV
jgi:thiamine biosynthesis protein ThiI